MAERITFSHVAHRLLRLWNMFPEKCKTWEIESCGFRKYRIVDKNPKNNVQYPLGKQSRPVRELFDLLADVIEPLWTSECKPLSANKVEIHHTSSQVAELAVNICNFLEDCDSADVVKLANCAFSKNYVLVVE